jgi:hypothetical protein
MNLGSQNFQNPSSDPWTVDMKVSLEFRNLSLYQKLALESLVNVWL